MHDEMLGCFILLFGCPGWVSCGKGRSPFVRVKGGGGFGWLMFAEMFGASMALYGYDFFRLKGVGGVDG